MVFHFISEVITMDQTLNLVHFVLYVIEDSKWLSLFYIGSS